MNDPSQWHVPDPDAPHVPMTEEFNRLLERLPSSATRLSHYLFMELVEGYEEWVSLYEIPIGTNRDGTQAGKPFSRPTLRQAIKLLSDAGLIVISEKRPGGLYKLRTVYPGEKPPFEGKYWRKKIRDKERETKRLTPPQ